MQFCQNTSFFKEAKKKVCFLLLGKIRIENSENHIPFINRVINAKNSTRGVVTEIFQYRIATDFAVSD